MGKRITILSFLIPALLLVACMGKSESKNFQSKADLDSSLKNLASIGENSTYDFTIISKQVALPFPPAPSDTLYRVTGLIEGKDDQEISGLDSFTWTPLNIKLLHPSLKKMISDGKYLTSTVLEDSFSENSPTFYHGQIALSQDRTKLYFITQDLDHSLESYQK